MVRRSSSAARRSARAPTGTRSGVVCATGVIDEIVSDHSPCTARAQAARTSVTSPARGAASPPCNSACRWSGPGPGRGYGLADLARWMAQRPAEIVGLPRKGRIAVGCDADLVAFAPEETFTVDPARLHHRHPVSPYAGQHLHGVVARDLAARGARGRRAARHAAISERDGMTDFTALPDLASRRLGGGVVFANDEFFAAADNLVDPASPDFRAEVVRAQGPDIRRVGDPPTPGTRTRPCHRAARARPAWYAAWSSTPRTSPATTRRTRRSRDAASRAIRTRPNWPTHRGFRWCPRCALAGDTPNSFAVDGRQRVTHVRLSIYPDGGVARLRVHGEVVADPRLLRTAAGRPRGDGTRRPRRRLQQHVLRFAEQSVACPVWPATMGEGWETARRRDDWQ